MALNTGTAARGLPWYRIMAGALLIVAGVAAFMWYMRPAEVQVRVRFDPERPAAGTAGRMLVSVQPGPGAGAGGIENVRVVVSPPKGIVFQKTRDVILGADEELSMPFVIDGRAPAGVRKIGVEVFADLPAGKERTFPRAVRRNSEVDLPVGPASAAPGDKK